MHFLTNRDSLQPAAIPILHPKMGLMLITQQGPTLRLFKQIERELTASAPLTAIAQRSCDAFYETFTESVVLVRLFVTLAYETLPGEEQAFARGILERRQIVEPIQPTTPVMTLLGTRGVNEAWSDRRASQSYRAIPLVSRMLVEAMPMTAQLFRVLDLNLAGLTPKDSSITEKAWGAGRAGLFYVEHAARTVDAQGRKIIAVERFVDEYGIQTVFGLARDYRDGLFLVQLVFCRHHVSRERAREFLPLTMTLRGTTLRAVDAGNVFPKA